MKMINVLMSFLIILPCLASAQVDGSKVITIDRKLWENWEGRAELKQLGTDVLGICGNQKLSAGDTVQDQAGEECLEGDKKLSASDIAQAQVGVECFEKEIAKYFPSYKTSKVPVKMKDGSVGIATVVGNQTAEAEKKLPRNAMMLLAHETPTCSQIARLTPEEDKKGQETRYVISEALFGKSKEKAIDSTPAVVRGFNCYVNLLKSF